MQNGQDKMPDIDVSQEPDNFTDPVLRCDSCNVLVRRKTIHKIGCCDKCGNKRFKDLATFDETERDQMIVWGLDAFVEEFQEVPDEG